MQRITLRVGYSDRESRTGGPHRPDLYVDGDVSLKSLNTINGAG
jgi:hypothetical protein